MSKITCNVINDLLPLYADSVLSHDSKALVEEHLEKCTDCRTALDQMKSTVFIEKNIDKTRIKKMEKRVSGIRLILVSLLLAAVLGGLMFFGISWSDTHLNTMNGAKGELYNYFVVSALLLMSCCALCYWGIYAAVSIRRIKGKEAFQSNKLRRICITPACALLAVYAAVTAGFFLTYYGAPADSESIELQTEFLYSPDSLFNQEWAVHFRSKNGKAINVFRREVVNKDDDAISIGYTVHEVPLGWMIGSDSFTASFSYGGYDGTYCLPEDFDFVIIVDYKDKTVSYSMRDEGLFKKQDSVAYAPETPETPDRGTPRNSGTPDIDTVVRSANGITAVYNN